MIGFLIPTEYAMAGVCAYAALHHALIARRRPVERTHLIFAVLCAMVVGYVVAKAGAYQAESAQTLISGRRWEMSFAALFFAAFPWFAGAYTELRPGRLAAGLSAGALAIMVANLVLPNGIQYPEWPQLEHFVLPWGERVVDLRITRPGLWHQALWLEIYAVFAYSAYACLRQHKSGARRRAVTLARSLGLFVAFVLFNQAANIGLIRFVHLAEFGFVALLLTMSLGLTRELRESERRMHAVLDHVPAVVYLKDTAGRYLWANRQHMALTGLANEALIGKTDFDLFPPFQAEDFRANDRQVLESCQPIDFEELENSTGLPRTFASMKFPLLDADGNPYAVCGVSTDITESLRTRKEMQQLRQQVWHADRVERMGAITASLAHELSQPLTAVLSNAQAGLRFLARGTPDLEELRAILQDIVRDDKRAAAVIAGLRAMLRQQETPRERVDLGQTVGEVLHLLHSEFLTQDVVLDWEGGPTGTMIVLADKAQIQQVALNLVLNALEAMVKQPDGDRHLQVVLADTGKGEARVAVRDNGEGIAADMLGKVFDGFYTTKAKGLGMGLAVCRSIVEAHGGAIWVERNEDRGVTFFFALPLQNREGAAPGSRAARVC